MSTAIRLNQFPYFDDFDPRKQFYRILFRPGYPVQARELTQIQSILQNQIEVFGRHLFENGAMIIPGNTSTYQWLFAKVDFFQKIDPLLPTPVFESMDTLLPIRNLQEQWSYVTVCGMRSGCIAEVLECIPQPSGDLEKTIFYRPVTGSVYLPLLGIVEGTHYGRVYVEERDVHLLRIGGVIEYRDADKISMTQIVAVDLDMTRDEYYVDLLEPLDFKPDQNYQVKVYFKLSSQLLPGETVIVYEKETDLLEPIKRYLKIADSPSAIGYTLKAKVSAGVFFANGFFIDTPDMECFVDYYSNQPSKSVGIKLSELVIDAFEDFSLNDPANNLANYNAPGADRLQIKTELISVALDDADELIKDKNHVSFIELLRFNEGELEKQLSRTVYAELAKEFARRTYDESGHYWVRPFLMTVADAPNKDQVYFEIHPGKAYVKGYEVETILTKRLLVPKPKQTRIEYKKLTNYQFTNQLYVQIIKGIPVLHEDYVIFSSNIESNIIDENVIDVASEDNFLVGYEDPTTFGRRVGVCKIYGIQKDGGYHSLGIYDIRWEVFGGSHLGPGVRLYSMDGAEQLGVKFIAQALHHPVYGSYREDKPPSFLIPLQKNQIRTLYPIHSQPSVEYQCVRTLRQKLISNNRISNVISANEQLIPETLCIITESNSKSVINYHRVQTVGTDLLIHTESNLNHLTVDVAFVVEKQKFKEKKKTLQVITDEFVTMTNGHGLLSKTDVFRLISVNGDTRPATLQKFILHNGQYDCYYKNATIQTLDPEFLKEDNTLRVSYSYFLHGPGDYFTVDSYKQSGIVYDDIPFYTMNTGHRVNLANCIDFRPIILDNLVIQDRDFVTAYGYIQFDVEYYLGRIDKLVVDKQGNFNVLYGIPAISPQEPSNHDDYMALYVIEFPDYTFNKENIKLKMIDNRNYTMRDIAKLDTRLSRLEKFTQLSSLEQSTLDLQITDRQGYEKFKSGLLVDNFSSKRNLLQQSLLKDRIITESKVSIDPIRRVLRPAHHQIPIKMTLREIADVSVRNNILTLNYKNVILDEQQYASTTVKIVPYIKITEEGQMKIYPSSDFWRDRYLLPAAMKNYDDLHNRITDLVQLGIVETVWNDWQTEWEGVPLNQNITEEIENPFKQQLTTDNDFINLSTDMTNDGFDSLTAPTSVGVQGTSEDGFMEFYNRSTKCGDRLVNLNPFQYIRPIKLLIAARGLKPLSRVFVYFDGTEVTDYCRNVTPKTIERYQNIDSFIVDDVLSNTNQHESFIVDQNGHIIVELTVPSGKFYIGERLVELRDSQEGKTITSYASTKFFAGGIQFSPTQSTNLRITNTDMGAVLNESNMGWQDSQTSASLKAKKTIRPLNIEKQDPIAQSFVTPAQCSGGAYLSQVGVYFKRISNRIPIRLEIRTLQEEHPTKDIIGTAFLSPKDIQPSDNGTHEAIFVLDHLVYLQNNTEYCFVLISNSIDYELWAAKLGEIDANTKTTINYLSNSGRFFKSQNSDSWIAHDDMDLKYRLYFCDFIDHMNGQYEFTPDYTSLQCVLPHRAIDLYEGSEKRLRIVCPNHGCVPGDVVSLERTDYHGESTVNTFILEKLGEFMIFTDSIDFFDYRNLVVRRVINYDVLEFELPFTFRIRHPNLRFFGDGHWTLTRHAKTDVLYSCFETLTPESTEVQYDFKSVTENKSIVNTTITNMTNVRLPVSLYVVNQPTLVYLGEGLETTVTVRMNTQDRYVSPVVDLDRSYLLAASNRINDKPIVNRAIKINDYFTRAMPDLYVFGHDIFHDTSESRSVTKDIKLMHPAKGLKIMIAANKPAGTHIDVYYRAFAEGEDLHSSKEKPWYKAFHQEDINIDKERGESIDGPYTKRRINGNTTDDEFVEMYYESLIFDANYDTILNNTVEPDELYPFTSFQIKCVFLSASAATVPEIKTLRVIAVS